VQGHLNGKKSSLFRSFVLILQVPLRKPTFAVGGLHFRRYFLNQTVQTAAISDIREMAKSAPAYIPMAPFGRQMSAGMTPAGEYGWISDCGGYRHETKHPKRHTRPAVPGQITDIWDHVSGRF